MTSNTDSDRLKRLIEALEKVRAINGSPDIINALLAAIEEVKALKKWQKSLRAYLYVQKGRTPHTPARHGRVLLQSAKVAKCDLERGSSALMQAHPQATTRT